MVVLVVLLCEQCRLLLQSLETKSTNDDGCRRSRTSHAPLATMENELTGTNLTTEPYAS
jgi:hypothetical protein